MTAMRIDRRTFLGTTLGAAATGLAWRGHEHPALAVDPDADFGPIIDTHLHVWDLKRFRLPWLDRAGERLNRSYVPEDYAKATEGLRVRRAVYVEVAVVPEQREAEADYVVELCRSKTGLMAAAVIGGNPADESFRPYVTRFKGSPVVKGVRGAFPRGAAENRQFLTGVRLLGELGMTFGLLLGSDSLAEAAKVVEACPGTRFVLDHCGNPDVKWYAPSKANDAEAHARRGRWEEGVARLAERPNVVCKISGVAESGEDGKVTSGIVAPVVNHCLDRFGDDRVIFASNWPVCLKTITPADGARVLRGVVQARGAGLARKLFHDNAARLYGL
jgi:L-fuconolactonase